MALNTIDDIVNQVVTLLDNETENKLRVQYFAEYIEKTIINLTHQTTVPTDLNYVWCEMTYAMCLRDLQRQKNMQDQEIINGGGSVNQSVSSVQEGNVTISYSSGSNSGASSSGYTALIDRNFFNDLLDQWRYQIITYRKVRW